MELTEKEKIKALKEAYIYSEWMCFALARKIPQLYRQSDDLRVELCAKLNDLGVDVTYTGLTTKATDTYLLATFNLVE